MHHHTIEPAILYFGTPVALLSTLNEDASSNLAPMSSVFWLGWRCVLGLSMASQTTHNLLRTGQCVVNLPSQAQAGAVDRLARTTGSSPVPPGKVRRGCVHVADKFARSGLTPIASHTVAPARVQECPVQLEAVLSAHHALAEDEPQLRGGVGVFELRVLRVHAEPKILMAGQADRIDPDAWWPLVMSFQRFYGLSATQPVASRLAQIPEALYRRPDVDRARAAALNGAPTSAC